MDATVVWKRIVGAELMGVAHGGVGLLINRASPGYLEFLENIGRPRSSSTSSVTELGRYRVRVKRNGEPRSRALTVFAQSIEAAGNQALQKVGAGWSVIELAEQPLD